MSNKPGFVFKTGGGGSRGRALQAAATSATIAAPDPPPDAKRPRLAEPTQDNGGSSSAAPGDVPAWPSLELDFSNLKPGPQESQFLDVIQRALQGAQELAKSTYTGDMAFLADAAGDMCAAVEQSVAARVMEDGISRSKTMRGASSLAAYHHSSSSSSSNPVNAQNAARLEAIKADLAKFEAEIAQWKTVSAKYALPADDTLVVAPPGQQQQQVAAAGKGSARKRKAAALSDSEAMSSSSSSGAAAAPSSATSGASPSASSALVAGGSPSRQHQRQLQHASESSLDPYDTIDDGDDGGLDEETLAKYGLAGSLGSALSDGLDELVSSAHMIKTAVASAVHTITASRRVIASVSTAIRGVAFRGIAGATAPAPAATKALLRNVIATADVAAGSSASAGSASSLTGLSRPAPPLGSDGGAHSATPAKGAGGGTGLSNLANVGSSPASSSSSWGGADGGAGPRMLSRPSVPDETPKILHKIQQRR